MSLSVLKQLGIEGKEGSVVITGFSGQPKKSRAMFATVGLVSPDGEMSERVQLAAVEDPVGRLYATPWHQYKDAWPHMRGLPYDIPVGDGRVTTIIGTDHARWHRVLEERYGAPDEPIARRFPTGWSALGNLIPVDTES